MKFIIRTAKWTWTDCKENYRNITSNKNRIHIGEHFGIQKQLELMCRHNENKNITPPPPSKNDFKIVEFEVLIAVTMKFTLYPTTRHHIPEAIKLCCS
jgi:hypothetical protein